MYSRKRDTLSDFNLGPIIADTSVINLACWVAAQSEMVLADTTENQRKGRLRIEDDIPIFCHRPYQYTAKASFYKYPAPNWNGWHGSGANQ